MTTSVGYGFLTTFPQPPRQFLPPEVVTPLALSNQVTTSRGTGGVHHFVPFQPLTGSVADETYHRDIEARGRRLDSGGGAVPPDYNRCDNHSGLQTTSNHKFQTQNGFVLSPSVPIYLIFLLCVVLYQLLWFTTFPGPPPFSFPARDPGAGQYARRGVQRSEAPKEDPFPGGLPHPPRQPPPEPRHRETPTGPQPMGHITPPPPPMGGEGGVLRPTGHSPTNGQR